MLEQLPFRSMKINKKFRGHVVFTCTQLSIFKKLFLPFHPIVIRLGLRGPSTLRAPYRLLLNCSASYFLSSYAPIQMMKKRKSLNHTYMNILNAEQMTNQRQLGKMAIL
jgi:hypothetical protein